MPDIIEDILNFNKEFVKNNQFRAFSATKYPSKKIAVLTCMDARLTELLPAALNLRDGAAKIIRNAGAVISHPFGSAMRSLMVAIYDLGVEDILVIGHSDCGMHRMKAAKLIEKMRARNITAEKIEFLRYCGVDLDKWLDGFDSPQDSVRQTVGIIRHHPLVPQDVRVYGFIMNPETGNLEAVK